MKLNRNLTFFEKELKEKEIGDRENDLNPKTSSTTYKFTYITFMYMNTRN
jgi:hypothetical protein